MWTSDGGTRLPPRPLTSADRLVALYTVNPSGMTDDALATPRDNEHSTIATTTSSGGSAGGGGTTMAGAACRRRGGVNVLLLLFISVMYTSKARFSPSCSLVVVLRRLRAACGAKCGGAFAFYYILAVRRSNAKKKRAGRALINKG